MTSSTLRPEYIPLQDAAALYAVSVDPLDALDAWDDPACPDRHAPRADAQ